jgi:DNA-binding NarL/FixJ family response regulator
VRVGVLDFSTHTPRLTSTVDGEVAWHATSVDANRGLESGAVDTVVFHVSVEAGDHLGEAIRHALDVQPEARLVLAAATGSVVVFADITAITPAPPSSDLPRVSLTAREVQVLAGIKAGLTNREIAQVLGTSLSTVNRYVENILLKLPARNRTQAAAASLNMSQLLSPNSQLETGPSR